MGQYPKSLGWPESLGFSWKLLQKNLNELLYKELKQLNSKKTQQFNKKC